MFGFKRQRRDRLRAIPLPQSWLKIIERNVPFYRCLPEADRRELQGHMQVFLDEKYFEGCWGLLVTDEIRVTIAGGSGLEGVEGQTFKIHFKRKCPQRQITECLRVKLKGFALLKHSKR